MDDTINFARETWICGNTDGPKALAERYQFRQFYGSWICRTKCDQLPDPGTAADMIKLAMIKIHQEFEESKFQIKNVLQVHDELVFDAHKG